MKRILTYLVMLLVITSCNYLNKSVEFPLHPEIDVKELPKVMTAELLWKLGRVSDMQASPDGKKVLYNVTWYDTKANKGNSDLYLVDIDKPEIAKRLTMSDVSEFNARWRPDGKRIGYLAPNDSGIVQLYEMDPKGGNIKIMTGFKESMTGFLYSPDGNSLLYTMDVKIDHDSKDNYADLPKANAVIANNLMYRHWDHWHDGKYSHIFFTKYDANSIKAGFDIMEGERHNSPMLPHGGMEQIAWSPDGNRIAYTCKKLTGKDFSTSTNSEIYMYDMTKKKTENLSRAGYEGYDMNPVFSPNGEMIAWGSMATPGFEADKTRLIIYSFSDGVSRNMSRDFDQSADNYVWSPKGDKLWFISGIHATYQVYAISLPSGEIMPVTKGAHDYTDIALAGNKLIGSKMNHANPSELFTIDAEGYESPLTFTNEHILKHIKLARTEERWIETTDGKKMHTWVIYPPLFDSLKTYPAILYCQGGPQSAVSQFFSFRWNFQMMAANGYIVVAPNRRGLPTFGHEWNDQISGDYGGQNMQDYLTAIDELSNERYVDKKRLGAVGASYGGFSVYWLAGNHDNRFKAFISHCGMFNLESMYGATEEYFFVNHDLKGPYWDPNATTSYAASPHRFVQNWNTPILIITGANDFRIPYTESLQAFNTAQLMGVPSKLLFFPEESHFILRPQNSILWQREFFDWLDHWLKN